MRTTTLRKTWWAGLPETSLLGLIVLASAAVPGMGQPAEPVAVTASIAGQQGTESGHVSGDATTGFRFESRDSGAVIDLVRIDELRFAPPRLQATLPAPPMVVELGPAGQVSGRLLGLSRDEVVLENWDGAPPLRLRRSGVRAVWQRPGEVRVASDGFEESSISSAAWTTVGGALLDREVFAQGKQSLRLPPGGAAATGRLVDPLESGRFEIDYLDDGRCERDQSRLVELTFRGQGGPRTIQVLLGWEESTLGVRTLGPEPTLAVQPLERRAGWHRLGIRFGARRTDITVDGVELAHGDGPGGPLVEFRLANQATQEDLVSNFDELSLVRFTDPVTAVESEPDQDEVRLVSGDQLFGSIHSADPTSVELDQGGSRISLPWSDLVGLRLRRALDPSEPVEGLWVRLDWSSAPAGRDQELDHLEGVLEKIDGHSVHLRAPYAGPVEVPTSQCVRMQLLGRSRRVVIDPNQRHLGNRVVVDLEPPQPEGSRVEWTFVLTSPAPAGSGLLLDVVQVIGVEGDANYSRLVREGWLRTHVELNGQRIGDLNSQITTRNTELARIELPIPDGILVEGMNTIRFVQDGTKDDPDLVDNLGLGGIILESPLVTSQQGHEQP